MSVDADIANATNQESDENAANQKSDEEPGDVTECVGAESSVIGANQLGGGEPNLKTDNVLASVSNIYMYMLVDDSPFGFTHEILLDNCKDNVEQA